MADNTSLLQRLLESKKQIKELQKQQLNPLQENILKTVQKVQKDQVSEAMSMGVPAENILQQIGIQFEQPSGLFAEARLTDTGIRKSGALTFGTTTEQLIKQLVDLAKIRQIPMEMRAEERRQRAEQRLQERLGLEETAEQRRQRQFQIRNLQYFGASVTPEMLQENPTLNSVITPLIKRFGITPEVNLDTNEITFEIPMQSVLQQKALLGGKIEERELGAIAERLPNLDRAFTAFKELKQSFNEAWQPKSIEEGEIVEGIFERLRGTSAIPLKSWTQTNPALHTYLSNAGAFSSLISKGGFLEAGVLTNQDIQRVLQALPRPGYSKERIAMSWRTIEKVLNSARQDFERKKKEFTGKQTQQIKQPKNEFQNYLNSIGVK